MSRKYFFTLALILPLAACQTNKGQGEEAALPKIEASQNIQEIKPDMEKLTNPEKANEKAPEKFKVKFKTTKGDITIEAVRAWSPNGADRFYNLVKAGFFTDIAFFRVLNGFVAQFGIHGDPAISSIWRNQNIQDDPVNESNLKGTISFATAGPNTRTTQFFINYADNSRLDDMGFSPFARVIEGMDVAESLYAGYGEGAPNGRGPNQAQIQRSGNEYLKAQFPKLDYIISASIIE